ncbi:hypothetical protein HDU76_010190 [Blyttiomyces sp. JEL0837]|nr:hypothetical protein HDU76_010190 [Blyttiomyces sp. JEL0837]
MGLLVEAVLPHQIYYAGDDFICRLKFINTASPPDDQKSNPSDNASSSQTTSQYPSIDQSSVPDQPTAVKSEGIFQDLAKKASTLSLKADLKTDLTTKHTPRNETPLPPPIGSVTVSSSSLNLAVPIVNIVSRQSIDMADSTVESAIKVPRMANITSPVVPSSHHHHEVLHVGSNSDLTNIMTAEKINTEKAPPGPSVSNSDAPYPTEASHDQIFLSNIDDHTTDGNARPSSTSTYHNEAITQTVYVETKPRSTDDKPPEKALRERQSLLNLTTVRSPSRNSGIDFYQEIETSEYRPTPQSHSSAVEPEILALCFAQMSGTFTVDSTLVKTGPLEPLKSTVMYSVAGDGSGGGGTLGRSSQTSHSSSQNKDRTYPLYSTPPSLLFHDLSIDPGQSQCYEYRIKLPSKLPSSHRGKAIRFAYKLTIGVERAGGDQRSQIFNIPFRLFGPIADRSQIFELLRPVVIKEESAIVVKANEKKPHRRNDAAESENDMATAQLAAHICQTSARARYFPTRRKYIRNIRLFKVFSPVPSSVNLSGAFGNCGVWVHCKDKAANVKGNAPSIR